MQEAQVVTLTLNPAVDVSFDVEAIMPTAKMRTSAAVREPGGGGVNVSRVCERFAATAPAVVALGGTNGERFASLLKSELTTVKAIPVAGETREAITATSLSTGDQYRFVLPGAELTPEEIERCVDAVLGFPNPAVIVLSGSVPKSVDPTFISTLASRTAARLLVDTSGPALETALNAGAYLIKPSARELSNLVSRDLTTELEVIEATRDVFEHSNAEVIVTSIGAGGAVAVTKDETLRVRAPAVQVRSAVGAGDSMVAGIAVSLSAGEGLSEALLRGVATGTAAVLTAGCGLAQPNDVTHLLPLVTIERL